MASKKTKAVKRKMPELTRQDSDDSQLTIIIHDDKELFTKELPGGYDFKLLFDEFANGYRCIIRKKKEEGEKTITLTLAEVEAVLHLSKTALETANSMEASGIDEDDEESENWTIPIIVKKKTSLRYKINNFASQTYLHVRRFYWGKGREDPEVQWRPTTAGICFDKQSFEASIICLREILEFAKKSNAYERNLVKNAVAVFLKEKIQKSAQEGCVGCVGGRCKTDNAHFSPTGCRSDWKRRVQKDFDIFFPLINKTFILEMCQRFLEFNERESRALAPILDSEIIKEYPIKEQVSMEIENKLITSLKVFYEELID